MPRIKRGRAPRSMRRLPPLQGQRGRQIHRNCRALIAKPRALPLCARPPSPRSTDLGPFSMISKRNGAQGAGQPRAGPRFTARRARSAHNVHAPRRAGPPTSTQGPRTFGLGPRSKVFGPDLSIPSPEKEQNKVAKGSLPRRRRGRRAPNMRCATRPDEARRKREKYSLSLSLAKTAGNRAARGRPAHHRRACFQSSSTASKGARLL